MIKKKIKQKKKELGENKVYLLNELYREIYLKSGKFNLDRFRVTHKDKINDLDELLWKNYLCKNKDNDHYYLCAFSLPVIDRQITEDLFENLEKAFSFLKFHYEEKQKLPLKAQDVMEHISLSDTNRLAVTLNILADASVFSSYNREVMKNTPLEAEFTVDERIINSSTFLDFLLRYEHISGFWSNAIYKSRKAVISFFTNKYVYPLLLIIIAEIVRYYAEHVK